MPNEDMRPRTVHNLKLREQYVRPIIEYSMRYQVRLNDRGYQAGDIVKFSVVDIHGKPVEAPEYCTVAEIELIEKRAYRVDFVTNLAGLEAGYVVFSISETKCD